jgi:hypothetical protein
VFAFLREPAQKGACTGIGGYASADMISSAWLSCQSQCLLGQCLAMLPEDPIYVDESGKRGFGMDEARRV